MDFIYNMVNTQFFKEDTHAPGIAVGGAVQRWTFPIATGQQLITTSLQASTACTKHWDWATWGRKKVRSTEQQDSFSSEQLCQALHLTV